MKAKINLLMLGIAAMLASCSSEDALQTDNNNGVVRITAQLADDMKTRAVTEEGVAEENARIDNYVLEVYTVDAQGNETKDDQLSQTNTSGVFALKLDRHENYRFYCWADEGDESAYDTSNGLANITLKTDKAPTIAHRGQTTDPISGESSDDITIQLTHAVAKVVLKTTSSLDANTVELSTNTYSAYDALKGEVTGDATTTITVAGPDEQITVTESTPVEALSFYTLVNEADFPVTIKYTTTSGDFSNPYEKVFDHAPFQADYRTIFIGNIAGLQYNDVSVTATLDKDWNEDNVLNANGYTIALSEAGTLTTATLDNALGDGNIVAVSGDMNENDMKTVFSWLKGDGTATAALTDNEAGIDIDLSDATATNFTSIGVTGAGIVGVEISYDLSIGNDEADRTKLRSIILPEGLKTIGLNAFYLCKNLTSVTLPQGLERISQHPFVGAGITELDLPSSMISANLYGTPDLKIVHIRGTVENFYAWDFSACGSLTDIYFHGNTTAPEFTSSGDIFDDVDKSQVTIHIPVNASIDDWVASSQYWNGFNFKNDIVTE